MRLTETEALALQRWLAAGAVRVRELLRHPEAHEQRLRVRVLMGLRDGRSLLAPGPELVLAPGDELLLAGERDARGALGTTLVVDATAEHVLTGERRPVGWLWRRLSRLPPVEMPDVQRVRSGSD